MPTDSGRSEFEQWEDTLWEKINEPETWADFPPVFRALLMQALWLSGHGCEEAEMMIIQLCGHACQLAQAYHSAKLVGVLAPSLN